MLQPTKKSWFVRVWPWHSICDQALSFAEMMAKRTKTPIDDQAIKVIRPICHAGIDYFVYGNEEAFKDLQ